LEIHFSVDSHIFKLYIANIRYEITKSTGVGLSEFYSTKKDPHVKRELVSRRQTVGKEYVLKENWEEKRLCNEKNNRTNCKTMSGKSIIS
jgi:hypothetical protein